MILAYLAHAHLVQREDISLLAGSKIAVDVNTWLRQLPQISDASLLTLGGTLCSSFEALLEDELKKFKQHNIRPVFIFPGVSPLVEQYSPREYIREKREGAWWKYEHQQEEETKRKSQHIPSLEAFEDVSVTTPSLHVLTALVQFFSERKIEFVRAPCLPWSQMFLLFMKEYVNYVFGANDLLIYPFDKVITKMDLEKGYIQIVDRRELLNQLGPAWETEQLLECCLLSGIHLLPTFSEVNHLSQNFNSLFGDSSFLHAYNLLSGNSSGGYTPATHIINYYSGSTASDSSQQQVQQQNDYHERFFMVKDLLLYHMYFDDDCVTRYMNISPNQHLQPSDLEIRMQYLIAPKMQDELYYLLSQGVISPAVINSFIHCAIYETTPLLDSKEFRDVCVKLNAIRNITLNIFATAVDALSWSRGRQVHYIPSASSAKLPSPFTIDGRTLLDGEYFWDLSAGCDILSNQKNLQNGKSKSLRVTFQSILNAKIPPSKQFETPSTLNELRIYMRMRLLAFLSYFHTDFSCRGKRSSVNLALSCFQGDQDAAALLFIESIRASYLNGIPFTPVTSSLKLGPSASDISPQARIQNETELLIFTRTMSFFPLSFSRTKYRGRIFKDLSQFTSIVTEHARSLYNLCESVIVSLFLKHRVYEHVHTRDISAIMAELSMYYDFNCASGCVWRFLLTEADDSKDIFEQLSTAFPTVRNMKSSLKQSIRFWNDCLSAVKILLAKESSKQSLLAEFESTDRWVKSKGIFQKLNL